MIRDLLIEVAETGKLRAESSRTSSRRTAYALSAAGGLPSLLGPGDVLSAVYKRREPGAVVATVVTYQRIGLEHRLEPLARVTGPIAKLGELVEVASDVTLVPRDEDRFDVRDLYSVARPIPVASAICDIVTELRPRLVTSAHVLVDVNWFTIRAVARELLAHGKLSGARADYSLMYSWSAASSSSADRKRRVVGASVPRIARGDGFLFTGPARCSRGRAPRGGWPGRQGSTRRGGPGGGGSGRPRGRSGRR